MVFGKSVFVITGSLGCLCRCVFGRGERKMVSPAGRTGEGWRLLAGWRGRQEKTTPAAQRRRRCKECGGAQKKSGKAERRAVRLAVAVRRFAEYCVSGCGNRKKKYK